MFFHHAVWPVAGLDEWVDGSLYFKTRNHHVLDQAIDKGAVLTLATVRDETGIPRENLQDVVRLIEGLGGSVGFVSSFHDWMKIRLPKSLMKHEPAGLDGSPSDFLRASKSDDASYDCLVRHVAAALEEVGLESLVSHMELKERREHVGTDGYDTHVGTDGYGTHDDSSITTTSSSIGRQLHAKEDENANEFTAYMLYGPTYQMFTSNKSDAALNIGKWINSPVMVLQCIGEDGPYLNGEADPDCTEVFNEITIVLTPMYSADINSVETVRLNITTDIIRKRCKDVSEICENFDEDETSLRPRAGTYVYGVPLYKYVRPNVLYQAIMYISTEVMRSTITIPLFDSVPKMYNYWNASAWSIRDLYGVDSELQGTAETVQGTALFVAVVDSAVNETAVNEYLSLLDISPHRQLEFDETIAPNNASICLSTPDGCAEEMSDVEILQSIAPNATTVFAPSYDLSSNDTDVVETLLRFLDSLAEPDVELDVVSVSWARDYTVSGVTIDVLENRLKKLATLGKTILAATGDGGADSFPGLGCWAAEFALVSGYAGTAWPAASPWVTSVGATQLLATGPNFETKEVACMKSANGGIVSSGGFSSEWLNISTPEWQQKAVTAYLQSNNASTFSGFPGQNTPNYNPSGRGYPDLAGYGAFLPILSNSGSLEVLAGTSLSAPLVASLITLVNQKLVSKGYKKIGYANPMLYWMAEECPEAFNDITMGNNQDGIDGELCPYGYPAAPGWDPVTGLGTIRFDPFVDCAIKWQDRYNFIATTTTNDDGMGQAPASGSHAQILVQQSPYLLLLLFLVSQVLAIIMDN